VIRGRKPLRHKALFRTGLVSPDFVFQFLNLGGIQKDNRCGNFFPYMSAERLASIEETVWTPGEQPALGRSLARSPFDPADDRDRLWTAYLPGVQPQIILAVRYRSRDEDFPPLQRYV